ncbi:MAG: cyclic nucleotide-binding domain-containing protein [Alphaproteobacteria bacterium]|nr:cyclic nucleotide-binding domain-containing protein [Alphaproteobacteria bacterium]
MSIVEDVEALRRIPYFATMDSAKLKLLAFTSTRVQLAQGGVLCREGEPGDAAYIVLEGEADIVVSAEDGRDVVVAHVPRNTFIGEMAVLRNAPRTATVVASSGLVALKVSKDAFFQLLRDQPAFAMELMRELAERLDDTTVQLRDARARLAALGA